MGEKEEILKKIRAKLSTKSYEHMTLPEWNQPRAPSPRSSLICRILVYVFNTKQSCVTKSYCIGL